MGHTTSKDSLRRLARNTHDFETSPLERLGQLLDGTAFGGPPEADEKGLEYRSPAAEDYEFFFALANDEFCWQHVAFRYPGAGDWSASEAGVALGDPEVGLTRYAAWLYRLCNDVPEKTFQAELARCRAAGFGFEAMAG